MDAERAAQSVNEQYEFSQLPGNIGSLNPTELLATPISAAVTE